MQNFLIETLDGSKASTIEPEELELFKLFLYKCRYELESCVPFDSSNLFVAGGYFARRYIGIGIRDIDVYINGDSVYFDFVVKEYCDAGYKIQTRHGKRAIVVNEKYTIDLINFHSPQHITSTSAFDFNVSKIAMDEKSVMIHSYGLVKELCNRTLVFHGSNTNNKKQSVTRLIKYLQMGFTINDSDSKFFLDWVFGKTTYETTGYA